MNFTLLQSQNTKKIIMENILNYKNEKNSVASDSPESLKAKHPLSSWLTLNE